MRSIFQNQIISSVVALFYFMGTLAQAQLRFEVLNQPVLSRQTGLYEQSVKVTNDFATEQSALKFFVEKLPPGVELWNRSGDEAGVPFLDVPSLVPNGSSVLDLRYYDSTRSKIATQNDFRIDGGSGPPAFAFTGGLGGEYTGYFGDVDGDRELTANDVLRVRQHINGLISLDAITEEPNADFDHDGEITDEDSRLIAKAVLSQQLYPSLITPDRGSPGLFVDIYDPALADMSNNAKVEVDGFELPEIHRSYPGSLTVMIPPQLDTAGTIDIVIIIDDLEVARHSFVLEIIASPTPDEFRKQFADVARIYALKGAELSNKLDSLFQDPVSEEFYEIKDRAIVQAFNEVTFTELSTTANSISEFFEQMPDDVAVIAATVYRANFPDYEVALRRLNEINGLSSASLKATQLSRVQVADRDLLQALCDVEEVIEIIRDVSKVMKYGCYAISGITIASYFIPGLGIAIGTANLAQAGVICAAYATFSNAQDLAFDFVPNISETLIVDGPVYLTGSGVRPTEAAFVVNAEIDFVWRKFCKSKSKSAIKKAIANFLRKKLEKELKSTGVIGPAYESAKTFFPDEFKKIDKFIGDTIGEVIDGVLGDTLGDLVNRGCNLFPSGKQIGLDHTEIKTTASPDEGTFSKEIENIVYTCSLDEGALPEIRVNFELEACKQKKTGKARVLCEEEQDVTFTIGDDGPALDDIFELLIDGDSILSSNSPVRSTSTTVKLTVGDHQMQMLGRAAPDNIGTYFVNVSGATVGPGPALSGTDLTAGRRFTWTITVEAPNP